MKKLCLLGVVLAATAAVLAHPHVRKTRTVDLPSGVEARVSYYTVPVNETHAVNADAGSFLTPGSPRLNLSGELIVGSLSIPAGDYIIGVVKNGVEDWTMALYPGRSQFREAVDTSKLIKLDSTYSRSEETSEHLLIDIAQGEGRLAGRTVLLIKFGSMTCTGALSSVRGDAQAMKALDTLSVEAYEIDQLEKRLERTESSLSPETRRALETSIEARKSKFAKVLERLLPLVRSLLKSGLLGTKSALVKDLEQMLAAVGQDLAPEAKAELESKLALQRQVLEILQKAESSAAVAGGQDTRPGQVEGRSAAPGDPPAPSGTGSMSASNRSARTTLAYLESSLPIYGDPQLDQVRQEILRTNLAEVASRARQQGMSYREAARLARLQASEYESAMAAAEECVQRSASDPANMLAQMKSGRSFRLPPMNMVGACVRSYLMNSHGRLANLETAKYLESLP